MQLHSIDAGFFKLDGGAMFGVVPKSIWQKLNPPDENNLCTWNMRCLLIETSNKLILVDCGMGNKQSAKFMGHYQPHGAKLDQSLAAKGFSPSDITDVFLTHLHFDHCGGAINIQNNQAVPAFKNAMYWSNQAHWDWATNPNAREKASFLTENILPIQQSGQLQFIPNTDNYEWLPNIKVRVVNGHTESMMLPQIQTPKGTFLYCADLLPSAAHIPLPYVMAYDTRPLITLHEKQNLLIEAEQNNYTLFFEHDPVNHCATLQKTERGIVLKNVFSLSEIM